MTNRPVRLPEVPTEFTEAILKGGRKIRRRRQLRTLSAVAAGLVMATFAGMTLTRPAEDMVLTETTDAAQLREVWAHPDDAYYHADPACEACAHGSVLLEKTTALEFGKEACGKCVK